MMQSVKNKNITYLLLGVVCLIWGIILYRIFFADRGGEDETVFLKVETVHEPYDQYIVKNNTFKLALNYRDPFHGKKNIPAELPEINMPEHAAIKPVVPAIIWPSIQYAGYVINPKTKRMVAILTVKGIERMIAEGESLEGIKLLKNKKDSILVSWMGKQKYIRQ